MAGSAITAEYVRARLAYDPLTGVLIWKPISARRGSVSWNLRHAGKVAGRLDSTGYIQIAIDGRRYPATHLIWLIVNGRLPSNLVDHQNRVRSDNRLANLREAEFNENARNSSIRRPGKFKGVKKTPNSKWEARICVDGKYEYLGVFETAAAAAAAYDAAARKRHGSFASTNFA